MARYWIRLLACTVLVSALGCSRPQPVRVTPRSVAVASVGPSGVVLNLELDVSNPNRFPIRATQVTGTLKTASGIEIGRGTSTPQESIPAEASAVVPAQLSVGWTNLAALAPLALSGQPVPFVFEGTAQLGGGPLSVQMPFALQGQLSQAELLNAGMRGMR